MGQDVAKTQFTREDRQQYRQKVRRSLDVVVGQREPGAARLEQVGLPPAVVDHARPACGEGVEDLVRRVVPQARQREEEARCDGCRSEHRRHLRLGQAVHQEERLVEQPGITSLLGDRGDIAAVPHHEEPDLR